MTPATLMTLTPAHVLEIYKAGIKRGVDEATSFDWNTRPSGHRFDDLEEALLWRFDDLFAGVVPTDYDAKKAWWEQYRQELETP